MPPELQKVETRPGCTLCPQLNLLGFPPGPAPPCPYHWRFLQKTTESRNIYTVNHWGTALVKSDVWPSAWTHSLWQITALFCSRDTSTSTTRSDQIWSSHTPNNFSLSSVSLERQQAQFVLLQIWLQPTCTTWGGSCTRCSCATLPHTPTHNCCKQENPEEPRVVQTVLIVPEANSRQKLPVCPQLQRRMRQLRLKNSTFTHFIKFICNQNYSRMKPTL